jgi:hypothetical protein
VELGRRASITLNLDNGITSPGAEDEMLPTHSTGGVGGIEGVQSTGTRPFYTTRKWIAIIGTIAAIVIVSIATAPTTVYQGGTVIEAKAPSDDSSNSDNFPSSSPTTPANIGTGKSGTPPISSPNHSSPAPTLPWQFQVQSFLPDWVNVFIGSGEVVERDSKVKAWAASGGSPLFRKTVGYTGPKNFDIPTPLDYNGKKPNVIIVMLESFRARDVGISSEHAPSMGRARWGDTWKTPTPNIDSWARKGLFFNNTWTSIKTMRSVESLLMTLMPFSNEVVSFQQW